jgi:hypothetical protein
MNRTHGLLIISAFVVFISAPRQLAALEPTSSEALPSLLSLRSLGATSPALNYELLNIGTVTSQGDFSPPGTPGGMGAAAARAAYGVDGSGIKVGVISDSYDYLGGAASGTASGDLPGVGNPYGYIMPVTVIQDDLTAGSTDEGRGMMEIVHDIAPGAQLYFHSAFNNAPGSPGNEIAEAINALTAAGCDIIIDDVGYMNEPFFQDGVAAQAVDAAKNAGVAYFSSAGNQARKSYEGVFNGGNFGVQDFDANANEGGDELLNISVPNNGTIGIAVEWNDPYPSVSGPASLADYDVGLYDFDASDFVSFSVRDQTAGADPWEIVGITNNSGATKEYGLLIQHYAGDVDKLLKAIVFGSGTIADDDDTQSPTIFGHTAAEGGVAVAAVRYTSSSVEAFSSRGGTTILFDADGNAIVDERDNPLLSATDGVDTSFFGSTDYEGNGFPNFFGTSAAAPHAGAAAALLLDYAHKLGVSLSVDELYDILARTARDIDSAGFDWNSGFGLIDLPAALAQVPEPSTLLMLVVGGGGLTLLRRGRQRRGPR